MGIVGHISYEVVAKGLQKNYSLVLKLGPLNKKEPPDPRNAKVFLSILGTWRFDRQGLPKATRSDQVLSAREALFRVKVLMNQNRQNLSKGDIPVRVKIGGIRQQAIFDKNWHTQQSRLGVGWPA